MGVRTSEDGPIDEETDTVAITTDPAHYDEPVERFIFELSTPEYFDSDARDRLRTIVRQAIDQLGAELIEYDARETSIVVALINTTTTGLAQLSHSIQLRTQRQYREVLDRERRSTQVRKDVAPIKWGGATYLGPAGGPDYRDTPPAIPDDEVLDHLSRNECTRLAMAYDIIIDQQQGQLKETLRERRPENPSWSERAKAALRGL